MRKSRYLVSVGDRVELIRSTVMDKAGVRGTVTRKYVPPHCTGVWSITVQWDGNAHETGYPYPTGGLVERVETERTQA
jgi:hypothetical protein